MNAHVIIIGQGICGTFLSWNLTKAGKKVVVIDQDHTQSASYVASGVINPVTGRSIVTTWMADELLPFAENAFTAIGKEISCELILKANVASFATSDQMQNSFEKRMAEANSYIQPLDTEYDYHAFFHYYFKAYQVEPSYVVDLHQLLAGWKEKLLQQESFINAIFDESQLEIFSDHIQYKHIAAKQIIFCNGTGSFKSGYWKKLPYALNKGQALIANIEGLPTNHVYKFGALSMVPWDNDQWWIGSSYENEFENEAPTESFRTQVEFQLKQLLKLPFTIVDHIAGVRPAVIVERRPFVGFHPNYPNIGILNGMGTKGCSLAPWFAAQLTEHILNGSALDPLADVKRFSRILGERQ
jgi:glycine/D-amino acid oxidase-like deaminating enzyme